MARERGTILVVDDEADVREMIDVGLSLDGYHVITAEGGAQALELLRTEEIDLLVTDFKMPGMNGVETVHRVREVIPSLPVVIITGYLTPVTQQQCLALGNVAFLRKPFEFRVLSEAVDALIRPP